MGWDSGRDEDLAAEVVAAADRMIHLALGKRAQGPAQRRELWLELVSRGRVDPLDEPFLRAIDTAARWRALPPVRTLVPPQSLEQWRHQARAFLEVAEGYCQQWQGLHAPRGPLAHGRA